MALVTDRRPVIIGKACRAEQPDERDSVLPLCRIGLATQDVDEGKGPKRGRWRTRVGRWPEVVDPNGAGRVHRDRATGQDERLGIGSIIDYARSTQVAGRGQQSERRSPDAA